MFCEDGKTHVNRPGAQPVHVHGNSAFSPEFVLKQINLSLMQFLRFILLFACRGYGLFLLPNLESGESSALIYCSHLTVSLRTVQLHK